MKWLGVDMHSHLLPGIDDGSPDVEETISLISKLHELGIDQFICTPHIFKELYPNTAETINTALELTKVALRKANLTISIAAAAEYMLDENFGINNSMMSLPNKHILVEMSYLNETPNIEQVIFNLQIAGYTVILAHPERYNFYHKAYDKVHRFCEMGVLLQLNLLSITGYYGREVKVAAEYLLKNKLYRLAGTDLHHNKHYNALKHYVENGYLFDKIGNYPFENKRLFKI
ncbi:tyrosine-protein phosphatase [Pedobacter sp. KBS0701]|uniref:tyrosine-protein phosphatase n=1 Tax=Pedobacter sp. KBS0701 TaxID=2578106 RepID=UPI001FEE65B2|nr:CpsB/CapC family capsule biosynthesis tyrosine phosphatase [Pedobacter sp. KBS0701]